MTLACTAAFRDALRTLLDPSHGFSPDATRSIFLWLDSAEILPETSSSGAASAEALGVILSWAGAGYSDRGRAEDGPKLDAAVATLRAELARLAQYDAAAAAEAAHTEVAVQDAWFAIRWLHDRGYDEIADTFAAVLPPLPEEQP